MRKIMAVLDVGNESIKLIVGEMVKEKLNILASSTVLTLGIKKGNIISEDELTNSIKDAIDKTSEKLNMKITKMIVIVPSKDAEFTIGEGTIKIQGETITGRDVAKVMTETMSGIVQDNMELVSNIPINFKLDNNESVRDPKGLISTKLNCRSIIITAPKSVVYPILGILEKLGIDVIDIAFDALGDYYTYKNKILDKEIGAIVNIGDAKTTISIFNKGILTSISNIELGGLNIDNDISYIYKVKKEVAKKLKEEFAYANKKSASPKEEITVINRSNEEVNINQYEISNVVNSRLNEILGMVKKEITHLTKKSLSYIIFTGGIVEMNYFKDTLENSFGKSATIGRINELGVRNCKFSSALGLIKWYNELEKLKDKDYSILSIDEQEKISGIQNQGIANDSSVISKVFGYFFDN